MRRFTLIILSLALGCVWGCSGKTVESKSPSKTEATAAKNSSKTKAAKKTERETAKKTTDPAPKKDSKKVEQVAQNSNPSSANTNPQTDPEPSKNEEDPKPKAANSNDAKLPEEFAAFSYIPKNSFALVSARPSAVLNSPLVKAVKPEDIPLDEILADVGEKSGVDPRDVDRFTFAVWIGKGHAYPGQMQRNGRSGRRGEGKSSSKRAVKTERVFEKKIEAVPKDPPESPNVEATDEAPDSCDELPPEAQFEVAYQPGGLGGVFGPKFDGVVVLNFNKPFDLKRIEERNFGDFETLEHNGTSYHADLNTAYYMPNPKTLLLSPKGDMPTVLDNNQTADIVKTAIEKHLNHEASLIVDLKPTRLWLQGLAIMLDEQQPGLADLPSQLDGITAHIDVKKDASLDVAIDANTEDAPKTIQSAYDKGYGMLGQLIAFEMPGELKRDLGDELGGQMTKLVHSIYANAKGQAEGQRFHLTVQVPETVTDVIPAYAKRQRELARMIERTNRAKNIGIAIHNYHSTFNEFPFPNGRSGAPKAEQGKLSWRVHLLPYLDQYPLYEEFKLDEAWDSDHNKKLLEKMPDVFKLSDQTKPGHTQFVLPGGEGFMGSKKGSVRFRDITDGSSNTIMVLSVVPDKAVPWTKPGAFELDVDKASEILGGGLRGFLAIFGDARVSTLDGNIDANSLKALLTISGNEVVYPEQFRLR